MNFTPRKRTLMVLLAVVAMAFWVPGQAAAYNTFSFFKITDNGNADVSDQLFVDVYGTGENAPNPAGGTVAIGTDEVGFYFRNAGPIASTVKEIYFDDGVLGGAPTIYDNPIAPNTGVDFVLGANPSDLPGGDTITPPFVATVAFNSEAGDPSGLNKKGIDIGEALLLTFTTNGDVLAALANMDLRIGLHVGSIGGEDGGSDSYVNVVPIPPSALLLGSGLLGLLGWRRFRKN